MFKAVNYTNITISTSRQQHATMPHINMLEEIQEKRSSGLLLHRVPKRMGNVVQAFGLFS